MKPKFRFTLDGSKEISDPIGWDKIEMNLERDLNYHSLIENIELPLEFYGSNGEIDGGYQYLKEARAYGVDTQIEFLSEISFDLGVTYETFFSGLLDLTTLIEIEHLKKFQCAIIRNNLWAKFINRRSIPVDIRSTVDLDGVAKTPMTIQSTIFPSQEIRVEFAATHTDDVTYALTAGIVYGQVDFILPTKDEIKTKLNYPRVISATRPAQLFAIEVDGLYAFDCDIYLSDAVGGFGGGNNQVANVEVYIQINDAAVIAFTKANQGTNGVDGRTFFTYTASHNLVRGDFVRIYIQNTLAGANTVVMLDFYLSFLTVTADTLFTASTVEGFYIHDAAMGVMDRIVGLNGRFYSEYFGGPAATFSGSSGLNDPYTVNGCGFDHQLFRGVNIRSYTLVEKPFSQSFDDWWEGANNIFNLGLGYDIVALPDAPGPDEDREVIRVEEKEHFYDSTSNSVDLENVGGQEDGSGGGIEISYDSDYLFTSIEIGYQKWEAESSSGIDDPQTVHTYASRFKIIGEPNSKDIRIVSPFIAAGLAIERTRREAVDKGKDWKLDQDTFIVQTDEGGTPMVRLYSASLITGLLNADTRYNVRLTPASNFARWKNYIANAFQNYTGDVFRFVKGEGNTDMTFSNPAATGCDAEAGTSADENADIIVGSDFLFLPILFKFNHPLTWIEYKAIRDNRKKSIGITWHDNSGQQISSTLFIKKLGFKVSESMADFQCWLGSSTYQDYQSILDRATELGYTHPSADQKLKQIAFIVALKEAGIWDELDFLYVFATDGSSDFATLNWKAPTLFKCTRVNSPTFTVNQGFTGNGSNMRLTTGWDAGTNGVHFTLDDAGHFAFVNNDITEVRAVYGGRGNGGGALNGQNILITRQTGGSPVDVVFAVNSTAEQTPNATGVGFYHSRRVGATDHKAFKNGVQIWTGVEASNSLSTQDIEILDANLNGTPSLFSNSQISVLGFGASLQGKEVALYNAWNNYFNSL